MGSRLVKFSFTPGENEQIEAVIKVPEEHRSIIHGIVKDHKNRNVKDAVVKLFEVLSPHDECQLKPITHAFTDECGQFIFGPLTACKQYVLKVWINNVKIRELVIRPDDCQKPHQEDNCRKPCHTDNHKPYKDNTHKAYHGETHQGCAKTCEEYDENNYLDDDYDD